MEIKPGEKGKFPIKLGQLVKYTANRAVEFEFFFVNGSTIKGIIPAGETLEFINHGDISDVNINIYEVPGGPRLVE